MVKIFSLHKYDINCYDDIYGYTKNEWTDFSDIGQEFEGVVLTKSAYLKVEKAYLSCLEYLMNLCDIEEMQVLSDGFKVENIDKSQNLTFGLGENSFRSFDNKAWINRIETSLFLKLMMRNLAGFAVTNQKGFFISSGFDFYITIGMPDDVNINHDIIQKYNLSLVGGELYLPDDPEMDDYRELFGLGNNGVVVD